MMAGKLNTQDIMNISLFEDMTKTAALDYIVDEDTLYLIIRTNNIGSVIGREGSKIKAIQEKMGKKIKVFPYSDDPVLFVENVIRTEPKDPKIIEKDGKKTLEIGVERGKKPLVLGKAGRNIKILREFLKRRFGIDNIVIR